MLAAFLDEFEIADTGNPRSHGERVDIERRTDPLERLGNLRREISPAKTQCSQAIDLGEGPDHHRIAAPVDQVTDLGFVFLTDIFGISAIDYEQDMRRQRVLKTRQFLDLHHRASRIVRIGQEQDPRPLGHAAQKRIEACREVCLRNRDWRRTVTQRGDLIHGEGMFREQNFVAGASIGLRQQVDDLIRSG